MVTLISGRKVEESAVRKRTVPEVKKRTVPEVELHGEKESVIPELEQEAEVSRSDPFVVEEVQADRKCESSGRTLVSMHPSESTEDDDMEDDDIEDEALWKEIKESFSEVSLDESSDEVIQFTIKIERESLDIFDHLMKLVQSGSCATPEGALEVSIFTQIRKQNERFI